MDIEWCYDSVEDLGLVEKSGKGCEDRVYFENGPLAGRFSNIHKHEVLGRYISIPCLFIPTELTGDDIISWWGIYAQIPNDVCTFLMHNKGIGDTMIGKTGIFEHVSWNNIHLLDEITDDSKKAIKKFNEDCDVIANNMTEDSLRWGLSIGFGFGSYDLRKIVPDEEAREMADKYIKSMIEEFEINDKTEADIFMDMKYIFKSTLNIYHYFDDHKSCEVVRDEITHHYNKVMENKHFSGSSIKLRSISLDEYVLSCL